MMQKNKVITDINILKIKEIFVHFFVHFLYTVFVIHFKFQPFFLVKKVSVSENKVFRIDVNFIKH